VFKGEIVCPDPVFNGGVLREGYNFTSHAADVHRGAAVSKSK
jgi:hypothetical protein